MQSIERTRKLIESAITNVKLMWNFPEPLVCWNEQLVKTQMFRFSLDFSQESLLDQIS